MKKYLIRALSAVLCIVLLTSMAFADFDPSLEVDTSTDGQIKVTVAQSDGLEKAPQLVIPCDYEYAYVMYNGQKIESTLENGEIRFIVSAGGEYVIVRSEAPEEPPVVPPPAVDVPTQPSQPTQPSGNNSVQLQPGTITEQTNRLEVAVGSGELSLDTEATQRIREAADGGAVTVSAQWDDTQTLQLQITAGEQQIDELGGEMTVSAPYELREEEEAETLKVWHFDENGKATLCESAYEDGTLSFRTEKCGEFLVGSFAFEDVSEDEWYYGNVVWAKVNGLFAGTTETSFAPETPMSRAMLITVLWRQAGEPAANGQSSFNDLKADYYKQAVAWAEENGIIAGKGNGRFDPDTQITREQLMLILMNFSKVMGMDVDDSATLESFKDAGDVSAYAKEAVQWGAALGLLQGSNGNLRPDDGAQRCQIASILWRYSKFN